MIPQQLDGIFRRIFSKPHGIVLVTGPDRQRQDDDALLGTGPAESSPEKNIVTIEDPVEYQLDAINQIQVNEVDRHDVCAGAAVDPAAGPGRDHGRRDP